MSADDSESLLGSYDGDGCAHDVVPISRNWGRCTKCGDESFPLTDDADPDAPIEHEVRLSPVNFGGFMHLMNQNMYRADPRLALAVATGLPQSSFPTGPIRLVVVI